ncbi:MAG: tRNA (guanine(46)-N(7))-methyltransferase TrmB [Pseudolabrys sp.]|nr:tRNA (guanine(46)-N(7))-methyltransferase TrmB [Pseudolabrys sp.]
MNEYHDSNDASQRQFFGRKKGHPLRARQIELFEDLLPKLACDLTKPAPSDLATLFPHDPKTLRLEIGFGGAEHLIAQAHAHPDAGFIGADGFLNAIGKALVSIDDNDIENVRLHHGDASDLIDWLPADTFTRIDLLYPDPWPKRRQWKRRFIQDDTLVRLARILKRGGELRLATDIPSYASYAMARIMRSDDFEWTAEVADDWRKPWNGWSRTRYEAKAIREERTPAYFIFRRV